MALETIEQALQELKKGKMIILVDDEDRENEGDLVLAAECVTPQAINFMITHARGLVCLSLPADRIDDLKLPPMAPRNRSPKQTAFTISIEAREGVSTGISASDRARTIEVASDPKFGAEDIVSPGHIFPLKASPGGVLVRTGHTEGSLDLVRLAGLREAAVICEIMNDDGSMARRPDLERFAKLHDLSIVSIKDVISYRMQNESLIEEIAQTKFPSKFSQNLRLHAFRSKVDGTEHLAVVHPPISNRALVRVHSECLTGDALGSLRCDCGPQLDCALSMVGQTPGAVLVYMRRQEGRGIGLGNKIRAYELQDQGMDTVDANRHLGFQPDLRHYGLGAQILRHLGVKEIDLLTNNPKKVVGLEGYGLSITSQKPIEIPPNVHNQNYLESKRDKMGHLLKLAPELLGSK